MNDDWSYKDVPIGKYDVRTKVDALTGEINQITDIAGKISEAIIQTKSHQIRNALIDLGWTPPEGADHMPESMLPEGFDRERWLIAAHECFFFGKRLCYLPWHDLLACTAYVFANPVKLERTAHPAKSDAPVQGRDPAVAE